jgi:hypothetical protein
MTSYSSISFGERYWECDERSHEAAWLLLLRQLKGKVVLVVNYAIKHHAMKAFWGK